jgi:3-oxoacid CoA-transferase
LSLLFKYINIFLQVIVVTTHTTKSGKPKIVKSCSLPLTGKQVVDTIITELCVFKVLKETNSLLLTELRNGATEALVRDKTSADFSVSKHLIVSKN